MRVPVRRPEFLCVAGDSFLFAPGERHAGAPGGEEPLRTRVSRSRGRSRQKVSVQDRGS
ncbi:MAG: AraC family ligand binding domain-containing protein [Opitutaceae bacterium]|nr:AraC family ligand binding domain-containing protein [Opitutaceae bacterium]